MSLFKSQGDKARDRLGPERVAFYLDAFQTLDSDGVCAYVSPCSTAKRHFDSHFVPLLLFVRWWAYFSR